MPSRRSPKKVPALWLAAVQITRWQTIRIWYLFSFIRLWKIVSVVLQQKNDLTDSKAKDSILKTDKKRASYYNYYSNKKWGDAASYQLCIDSSVCGIDGSVEAILNFVALKEAAAKKK